MPIVGHLGENGLIVADEFRQGNEPPAARSIEFIKKYISKVPKGKKIHYMWADTEAYQAGIINFYESEGIQFTIGADLDHAVVEPIEKIPPKGFEWV